MRVLIKNGRVIDPANGRDEVCDIFVEDGKIAMVARNSKAPCDETIDAAAKICIPGLVDMHVHLREPGREDKETVESGTRAALKGGVTSLLAMPNTSPAIDSVEGVRLLKEIIAATARAHVYIAGAITKSRAGKELADIVPMRQEGAVAITDDGASVDNEVLFAEALEEARRAGVLVACHCEDRAISGNGVVNRGIIATRMGLRGISNESEYERVERDIRIAERCGAPIHIQHVSCRESVEAVARAKQRGVRVTCETTPHHLTLSEEVVAGFDTNCKMNPPLRGKKDVEALRRGLKEGVIDCIASDHAPHTENEKDIEFDRRSSGW